MTILEMFEREDIYSIIEKTMAEYYEQMYQTKVDVTIKKHSHSGYYLVYPRLGVIMPKRPTWDIIKIIYVYFDVQGNILKKLFAWAYITICLLTFGLLADASYEVSDSIAKRRDILIIPCNRKIKVFYYGTNTVDSILKDGFNDFYFNNEVRIRTNPEFDFILPVVESGKRWYREKLLRGRCLVRTSAEEYKKYLNDVVEDLKQVYSTNYHTVLVKDYVQKLVKEYRPLLEKIVAEKHITCADKIKHVMAWCETITVNSTEMIPVTTTHGDLQTGNIYVDEEQSKAYIIDWETAKVRSVWYDAATVMCSTRRKDKFSDMINHCDDENVRKQVTVFDNDSSAETDIIRAVLLMEEMGFFLEEIVDLPGAMGSEIIERYEHEIDHIKN